MSSFYFHPASHASLPHASGSFSVGPSHGGHHGGRSRRNARYSASHGAAKAFHPKPARVPREPADEVQFAALRKDYDAARSFDLDDDEMFCPWHLLTEDDVRFGRLHLGRPLAHDKPQLQSIHSGSSDRSSSSGGSPQTSPMQPQVHPTPTFSLSATAAPHLPASMQHSGAAHLKIHQPMAQRTRNAIPIVDPNSRNVSPPNSISPGRHNQKASYVARRW